jgi:hypothetical protein
MIQKMNNQHKNVHFFLDIHKLKLSVEMSQDSKGLKMNFFVVFLVNFGRMSFIN